MAQWGGCRSCGDDVVVPFGASKWDRLCEKCAQEKADAFVMAVFGKMTPKDRTRVVKKLARVVQQKADLALTDLDQS
jgi:hypothetical protein